MTDLLPQAIIGFFQINPSNISPLITQCFQPDAIVEDENKIYQGHLAIHDWLQQAFQNYQFHADPLDHIISHDTVTSTALVSGNFQNSPATLTYQFQLKENRITHLEISA